MFKSLPKYFGRLKAEKRLKLNPVTQQRAKLYFPSKPFPFSRFIVSDKSMEPLYVEGDHVLVFNWVQPKIGDVVIVKNNNVYLIKRVIKTSRLRFLVCGDNRLLSSRAINVGKNDLIGKVVLKY